MTNTRPNRARRIDDLPEADANRAVLRAFRMHMLAGGRTEATVDAYMWRLQALADRLKVPLLEATAEDLVEYVAMHRRFAAETRKSIRSKLRTFYGWATNTGRIPESPADALPTIRVHVVPGRVADDAELSAALAKATDVERAAILLARNAGLRLSEMANLNTHDRDGESLRILGKGEKPRLIPIGRDLAEALDLLERRQGKGFYFRARFGDDAPMHAQSLHKIIKRATGWNPHSLRHAAATAAYRATGDLRAVQEMLGHASVATTQRYVHTSEAQIRAAVDAGALQSRTRGLAAS